MDNFLWEIIKYLKDILLYKTCGTLQLYNSNELDQIKVVSEKVSKDRLLALIYDLSELANSIKWSSQKQIVFEAGIIKVCTNISGLEDRIKALEDKFKNGVSIQNGITSVPFTTKNEISSNTKEKKLETPPLNNEDKVESVHAETPPVAKKSKNITSNAGKSVDYWSNVINNLKQQGKIMLYTNLLNTTAIEINDLTLGIEFPNGLTSFGKTVIEQPENMHELVKQVSILAGKEMRIKLIDSKSSNVIEDVGNNNGLSDLGININIIDN